VPLENPKSGFPTGMTERKARAKTEATTKAKTGF
jgi:hypothetical protein